MAIYAIADLHLSAAAEKPMDIFQGWDNHQERLVRNWEEKVKPEDTIVLAGDISWGMSLKEALPDLRLIHNLPGKRKVILKGNHDYWWTSVGKMTAALEENGLCSLCFLHNNSYYVEGVHLCGSRGWIFENGQPHDEKLVRREAMRIEASLKARGAEDGETVLFLHYPPAFAGQMLEAYFRLMRDYGVRRCFYGHIHGPGHRFAVRGEREGVMLKMISADYLNFDPIHVTY
ncbi:MAG: metallophosphoesterase [Oscillospiraceae bacterium]|jgi:predicted phosphohydrolase|nr:metallophosphoesterase [Oscillospiraceae bacterium]